jgi:hypothetical protein
MRSNPEYQICKAIATYLKYQYPNVLYRFDGAGQNLSIAAARMNKSIQKIRGYPDLLILEPKSGYHGLFIELKKEGTKILNKAGKPATDHIQEQQDCMTELALKGYFCAFAVGFDAAKNVIDKYFKL